jgi:hypothetical protein
VEYFYLCYNFGIVRLRFTPSICGRGGRENPRKKEWIRREIKLITNLPNTYAIIRKPAYAETRKPIKKCGAIQV